MENQGVSAAAALNSIIRVLGQLDEDARQRVLKAVATFFHDNSSNGPALLQSEFTPQPHTRLERPKFSEDSVPSPKQFLLEKQPRTDVERIAALAYYLTVYRDMPHFKTLDLAKLNTEAAQPKFSNTAYSATNAAKLGYLAPAPKGQRQISAAGEQFVRALPDRDAARMAMSTARPRRIPRRKSK